MAETFEEEQKSQEAGCASRGKSGAVRGRWTLMARVCMMGYFSGAPS